MQNQDTHKISLPEHLANHFRQVHFGGNWTAVNLKDTLEGITWQQAVTRVETLNTIAALVFHINYYVKAILKVLKGEALEAHDRYSFDVPEIESNESWESLLNETWEDAREFSALVEKLPESRLWENFAGEKYGTYLRNIQGVTEHTHYHLGQVVVIKKHLLQATVKA